ncbi:MAG: DMT family transporter [Pseudomonadota bacterium]
MTVKDWFWLTVLGIGWGSTFFFNAVLLDAMGPVSVSLSRIGLAAVTMWVLVIATGRRPWVPVPVLGAMAGVGFLMFGLPFTIYPVGQQVITAGAAGIINAMTPVMVVIVSHFWPGGERATWAKSMGVVAGFAGIVLLSVPAMRGEGSSALWGLMFTLLAPLCYGTAVNYVRRLSGVDPWVMLAWAFTIAALALALVVALREGVPGGLTLGTLGSMAFLGVVLTALAFIVFFAMLPRVGATNMSTVTFIAPVSAVLLGVLFLGETVDVWKAAGMVAIFVGLLLIDGRVLRAMRPGPKDQPNG